MASLKTDQSVTVLVINENSNDARSIRQMLQKADGASFDVHCTCSYPAGLKRLARGNIDVILLSTHSSQNLWVDILPEIKSRAGDIPVVILADEDDTARESAARESGIQDYLVKRNTDSSLLVHSLRSAVEYKRLENALRESEAKFRLLFDNINSGVALYEAVDNGRDYIFRDFNKAAENIDKIKKEELLGRKVTAFFPGVKAMGLLEVLQRVWLTGRAEHHPTSLYMDERSTGWRNNFVSKLRTGELLVIYEDVTDYKRKEEELQAAEDNFRNTIENSPLGISIVTRRGQLLYANPAILDLYGYGSIEELKSIPTEKLFTPASCARRQEILRDVKLGKPVPSSYELEIISKSGEIRHVIINRRVVIWNKEEQIELIYQDVTEQRRLYNELRKAEQNYLSLVENGNDGIIVNQDGIIIFANAKMLQILGFSSHEIVGKPFPDIISPEYRHVMSERYEKRVAGDAVQKQYEVDLIHKNGSSIPVEISASIVEYEGKPAVMGIVHDISERREMVNALIQQMKRESTLAELANKFLSSMPMEEISKILLAEAQKITSSEFGFVCFVDPNTTDLVCPAITPGVWFQQTDDKETIIKSGQGLGNWLMLNRHSVMTNTVLSDTESASAPPSEVPLKNFLSAPAMAGEELVGQIAVANANNDYTGQDKVFIESLASMYSLALQRKKMEDIIHQLAYYDALTGLPNRVLFHDHFVLALAAAKRYPQKVAVMVADIDNFKMVNDTLGHDAGDIVLKGLGGRIVNTLRKTDTVSRMGGDEFTLLVPEINETSDALKVASKISETVKEPFLINSSEVRITISIGIALYPDDSEDIETLVKYADTAMYQAKTDGRNKFLLYKPLEDRPTMDEVI